MTKVYELRLGNGNVGNYHRANIAMEDSDCPYSFMNVVFANEYLAGKYRKHAYANTVVDGEAEYTIHATIFDGPKGETEMGAAFMTASLEPTESDATFSVKEYLDRGAMMKYKKIMQSA